MCVRELAWIYKTWSYSVVKFYNNNMMSYQTKTLCCMRLFNTVEQTIGFHRSLTLSATRRMAQKLNILVRDAVERLSARARVCLCVGRLRSLSCLWNPHCWCGHLSSGGIFNRVYHHASLHRGRTQHPSEKYYLFHSCYYYYYYYLKIATAY